MYNAPESEASREESTLALLEELEVNRPEAIRNVRESATLQEQVVVTVRHANMSARSEIEIVGSTREIQKQGLVGRLPNAILVGDIYHVEFDREQFDIAPLFAICDRCTMLDETAFDLHFRFLHDIDLSAIC